MSLPLNARVSDKLREKIWKDEFIDFGSLLVNPVLTNRFQLTVQDAASGYFPLSAFEPVAKSKKIASIESWLNSFHIFVGIYTERFPHEDWMTWKIGKLELNFVLYKLPCKLKRTNWLKSLKIFPKF